MQQIQVYYHCLQPEFDDLLPPKSMTDGASGVDLSAAISENITIEPGETKAIPTAMQLEIPRGYEGQIRPRSGLALKHNVGILNSPGTIDADYRGEVQVILTNFGKKDFLIHRGDRIAQLVIQQIVHADFIAKNSLNDTQRGTGGFGHTGQ